ncbi:hypothetical protein MLD38_003043 [Melastoma candidum]|uniref:Uncharacterized protein n=1 Tax=Melastoma candidum TaxID=119954 RepID=A0ACB9S2P3_9MYRT|nr:hypothetical protein MLD38_003043 [Melastoma candidum]
MSSYKALAFTLQVFLLLVVRLQSSMATIPPVLCPPPPPPSQPTMYVVYSPSITAANGTVPPNATRVPVAGIQGMPFNLKQFGTVFVIDDNITATPDPTTVIGVIQGTITVTSFDGSYIQFSVTFIFNSGPYANATLVVLGATDGRLTTLTAPVVGGTNAFLYATGFVTAEILYSQGSLTLEKITIVYKIRP